MGGTLSRPSPLPPIFRLPLGCDSSTHLGACATLWLCPHPSTLSGEPPAAPSHPTKPTFLQAQPACFQARASACLWGEGLNRAFLSL